MMMMMMMMMMMKMPILACAEKLETYFSHSVFEKDLCEICPYLC